MRLKSQERKGAMEKSSTETRKPSSSSSSFGESRRFRSNNFPSNRTKNAEVSKGGGGIRNNRDMEDNDDDLKTKSTQDSSYFPSIVGTCVHMCPGILFDFFFSLCFYVFN